ncbi:uncharacterized protein AMSG_09489 [Thecamonas trahens ATCC 50062]|uniref:Uncharacterized protein n=1 Tax=Thecamonas trahens ATCC 50062 TaxID=461836 RepID=A0A0L0DN84_THETB|nr:hypothetical protein AMSG_09489 [Thecamonas trahens ATCC 50062]KNC53772.1 hypothetical protein AMSG_09489 [Thecamonas trahens ATCC 50062]|eukprot:XP_013754334.1 hypothetical protein AMSG_09489 [Thecamonas trahens ATCC 50062]
MATLRGDARLAAHFNPVDCDKIVKEGIVRELSSMRLKEEYSFNDPRTTYFVTDKPTNMELSTFTSDEDLPAEFLAVAKAQSKTPKEKYDMPLTEAQEIGWYADEVEPPSSAAMRFSFRSGQSEMSKHANALTTANWSNIRR